MPKDLRRAFQHEFYGARIFLRRYFLDVKDRRSPYLNGSAISNVRCQTLSGLSYAVAIVYKRTHLVIRFEEPRFDHIAKLSAFVLRPYVSLCASSSIPRLEKSTDRCFHFCRETVLPKCKLGKQQRYVSRYVSSFTVACSSECLK